MNKAKVAMISFSPTGTTESVLDHIASGMGQDKPVHIDLTNVEKREVFFADPELMLGDTDRVLVAMPVYFGYIPQFLKEKIKSLDGKGRVAVAIVVYGNRDFDDALKELCALLEQCGFRVVAAVAFIGEHSFSSVLPIAVGRPDREDLRTARRLGERLSVGLDKLLPLGEEDVPGKTKGRLPAKPVKLPEPPKPRFIPEKCNQCGVCTEHCPMGIIDPETFDFKSGARSLCLGCMGCVKKCGQNARVLEFPFPIKVLLKKVVLNKAMKSRREPVVVLK